MVHESLKKDKEVVLEAVKQHGGALQYANESLKKDKEVVLEAVQQHGWTLQYADESLKKDALNRDVDVSNTPSTQAMETNVQETSASFSFRNARAKSKNITNSRIAAVQGCLYSFSALFTAVWVFLPWVGFKLQVEAPTRFFFAFMLCLLAGSQGTFNLFIFVRVQYLRLREQNGEWTRLMCIRQCLLSSE